MLDRLYCFTCKHLFPDYMETRKAQKEITIGQFLYNQQCMMWGEPIKFTGDKRVFIINCPHCNSMHNVNATEIKERTDNVRTSGRNQYTHRQRKIDEMVLKALEQEKA